MKWIFKLIKESLKKPILDLIQKRIDDYNEHIQYYEMKRSEWKGSELFEPPYNLFLRQLNKFTELRDAFQSLKYEIEKL